MHLITLLGCVLLGLTSLRFLFSWLSKRWSHHATIRKYGCKAPPRFPLDWTTLTKQAIQNQNYLDTCTQFYQTYGKTYKTTITGRTVIRSADPDVAKAVISTYFDKFGLQPIRYDDGVGFFGKGMLVVDGEHWKRSRSLIKPIFDVAHVSNFERLGRHVGKFLEILPKDGSTVDLLPLLQRLTLDISTEFIFGESVNALSKEANGLGPFIDAFVLAQRGVVNPAMHKDKDWLQACKQVHEFIDARVEMALSRGNEKDATSTHSRKNVVLVDELVKATRDPLTLRDLILSVFSPAHDTIAVSLSNVFFHLARNPDVWDNLRNEILALGDAPLTYDALNSLKYLSWVLRESHRVTPLIAATFRACVEPVVLPCGGGPDGKSPLYLKTGDWIENNIRTMMRDKDYWGEDADNFRPERWATMRPTWEYIPFSGGARICPAVKLVFTDTAFILVEIMKRFSKLENRDPTLNWIEERRLIFQSKRGTLVGLHV